MFHLELISQHFAEKGLISNIKALINLIPELKRGNQLKCTSHAQRNQCQ